MNYLELKAHPCIPDAYALNAVLSTSHIPSGDFGEFFFVGEDDYSVPAELGCGWQDVAEGGLAQLLVFSAEECSVSEALTLREQDNGEDGISYYYTLDGGQEQYATGAVRSYLRTRKDLLGTAES